MSRHQHVYVCACARIYCLVLAFFFKCIYMHVGVCLHDEVPGNELIGHMSAQMSSLFNKAGELNCHYCQHLTVVLPARWYLVIYHSDELSPITLYSLHDESNPGLENGPVFNQKLLEVMFRFPLPLQFLEVFSSQNILCFTKLPPC